MAEVRLGLEPRFGRAWLTVADDHIHYTGSGPGKKLVVMLPKGDAGQIVAFVKEKFAAQAHAEGVANLEVKCPGHTIVDRFPRPALVDGAER